MTTEDGARGKVPCPGNGAVMVGGAGTLLKPDGAGKVLLVGVSVCPVAVELADLAESGG